MRDRPSVLLVTERILYPPLQGYRVRIVELIRALRGSGVRVILLSRSIPGLRPRLWTRWLVDELITVDAPAFTGGRLDAYDCTPFLGPVADAVERFDPIGVIAEYAWMAPSLAAVPPGVATFVDTHDVMHRRGPMYGGIEGGAWVECSREEEARALALADAVIAIQPNEQRLLRAMMPEKPVICVPHHSLRRSPHVRWRRPADVVAFVGSDNRANVGGIQAFVREAWPVVRSVRPAAELRVFGTVVRHLADGEAGVTLVGPVRRLATVYSPARVVINPVHLGTGLKIKTVEALSRGRAVVTTSCGAEGLETDTDGAFLVEDDMERFACAVAGLLADDRLRRRTERAARAFAERHFSRAASVRELLGALRLTHPTPAP